MGAPLVLACAGARIWGRDPCTLWSMLGTRSLARGIIVGASLAALAIVVVFAMSSHGARTIRIATGPRGGTFLPLGQAIASVIERQVPRTRAVALESPGGRGNIERLERGEVDFALVPNDAQGGPRVRAIAPLYDEVLQVVVRVDEVSDLMHLRGRRVSIGPRGSGTEEVALHVLSHFGVARGEIDARSMQHLDAAEAFARGELDAVFVLAGVRTPVVERLLRRPGARLLSLGDPSVAGSVLEGVRLDAPFLTPAVVPARAYGASPPEPVGTVSVRALLVTRVDVPDALVHDVTRALFENRVELTARERLLARMSETIDPSELSFPLHTGAVMYYHRHDPPFIQRWADTISLGITVALLLWSGGVAVRTWMRRRRKNRVDSYYLEVQKLTARLTERARLDDLLAVKESLRRLRRRAFEELMAERLEANESFTIFQDYVRSELLEVDAMIRAQRDAGDDARESLAPTG